MTSNAFRYAHVLARMIDQPLLVSPARAQIVLDVLLARARRPRAGLDEDDEAVVLAGQPHVERKGYDLVAGIAVVPVSGTLVHKLGGARPVSGMLGYDSIRLNFETALQDGEARGILLMVDSPGGEVPGCFDLCDTMFEARGEKPVWACVDETACSAAYAVASIADRIVVPRTAIVGSIGVVCMHLDISAALDDAGIKPTFIQYGLRKTDAAPELPLSPEARETIQRTVDAVGDLFVEMVARNRGLAAADVKAQEAGVFQGIEAVRAGLADAVMAADECFAEFHQFLFGDGR